MGKDGRMALNFENLEDRLLLANVSVAYNPVTDSVAIESDDPTASDDIVISTDANGNLVITGQNGTTINGQASFTIDQPVDSISVETTGGSDSVSIQGVNVSGGISVSTAGGGDTVVVNNSSAGGLNIDTGEGSDSVLIASSQAGSLQGSVSISTGDGSDDVGIVSSDIISDVTIQTGGDDDEVVVGSSNIDGNLDVETDLRLRDASGNIRDMIDQTTGNDEVTIVASNVGGTSHVATRGGNDQIVLQDSNFSDAGVLNTGIGNDSVDSFDNNFTGVFNAVFLASGDDEMNSGDNDFRSLVTLVNGGMGLDVGTENPDDNYAFTEPTVTGFEAYFT